MEGDAIGDLLWGLTLIVGFLVLCIIVLNGTTPPQPVTHAAKAEHCYIPGAFFRELDMDSFEARREWGCVKRLVYDDLDAPSPLAPLRMDGR